MKPLVASIVAIALAFGGPGGQVLAAGRQPRPAATESTDPAVMERYARALAVGSSVRVRTADGVRATVVLMAVETGALVVQRRSRRPEPPYRIPISSVRSIEPSRGHGGVGPAIAAGALAGVGAFLALLLAAIGMSD